MDPKSPLSLHEIWNDLGAQIQLLTISGLAGAVFRTAFAPEAEWRRRIVQGLAGAASAIFLGGLAAGLVNSVMDVGAYAYLAAGFIMGSGGEFAVKAIQERILGKGGK